MLIALLLVTSLGASADLPKTDPKEWSKDGWYQFRWGMGPGDVAAKARALNLVDAEMGIVRAGVPPNLSEMGGARFEGFLAAGFFLEMAVIHFDFVDGRLRQVEIVNDRPKDQDDAKWNNWFLILRNSLYEKYGMPHPSISFGCFYTTETDPGVRDCEWRGSANHIALTRWDPRPGHLNDVRLQYEDAKWLERLVASGPKGPFAADNEKL